MPTALDILSSGFRESNPTRRAAQSVGLSDGDVISHLAAVTVMASAVLAHRIGCKGSEK